MRNLIGTALFGALTLAAAGQAADRVQPRPGAGYVLRDGTIQIVAGLGMGGVVRALDELYAAKHPGVKFRVLEGDNYSAMAALTFDKSAVGAMGTEYTRIGLGDNLKIAGEPVGFRVGHASLAAGAKVPALGVIVHPSNPLASLSLAQLTRLFAVGGPGGDIAVWGQAGVKGALAAREVRTFGPMASDYMDSDDPQAGEFLSTDKMGGLNMGHGYVGMAHYADVVQRVSEDPAAIGIVALNVPLNGVKVLALKGSEAGVAVPPNAKEMEAGRYPLDRFVYVYLRVGKSLPLDEFGKDYLRLALSEEGQRAIAAEAAGYLPLNAGELAEERAKLDR